MAAPADVVIEDLTGVWIMDKSLSSDTDPLLALQGMNWIMRRAIGMSTVVLDITFSREINSESSQPQMRMQVTQSTTSGLSSTSDSRLLDWSETPQEDRIFGKNLSQARFVRDTTNAQGKVVPKVEVQTAVDDEKIRKFLSGEILADNTPCEGFLVEEPQGEEFDKATGLWVQLFVRNQNSGWTAEQIWGFEMINNERRYVRRAVVTNKDGKYHLAQLVYKYSERKTT